MPGNITILLDAVAAGDHDAWDELIPAVYQQLRQQARAALRYERPGHTLHSTDLVHELFLRLVGREGARWNDRAHFYKAAAMALNWVLVDHARHRNREGGPGKRVIAGLDDGFQGADFRQYSKRLEVLDLALKRLGEDPRMQRKCRVINLRFFMGLTDQETADELGVSINTVRNDWEFAKAWLLREMKKIEGYGI